MNAGFKIEGGDGSPDAIRTAVEMLVDEHGGDCLAPCERACPAGIDIPAIARLAAAGDFAAAAAKFHERNPFPAILGRICEAPCQTACRRGRHDQSVAVRRLERFLGDLETDNVMAKMPRGRRRVAIYGSGLAELTAAYYAAIDGAETVVVKKGSEPGGELLREPKLPKPVIAAAVEMLGNLGIVFAERAPADFGILTVPVDGGGAASKVAAGRRAVRNQVNAGFDSRLDFLTDGEMADFIKDANPADSVETGLDHQTAAGEAGRCLNCDCLKKASCRLRAAASALGVGQKRQANRRRRPFHRQVAGEIVYESGKCVLCGACVRLAEKENPAAKLTFSGRGFDSGVAVPFNAPLDTLPADFLRQCARVCPTGAFSRRRK